MNLKNILCARNTGDIVPDAPIGDNLFGLKLSGGSGVITTATGNPVSIVTNKAQNALDLQIAFSPRQSGTGDPSPTNIRPIEGWTEVNFTRAGKNYLANADIQQGSFHTSTGKDVPLTTRIRTENYIPFGNGTYNIINKEHYEYVLYVYNTDGTFLSGESKINWQAYGTTFSITTDRLVRIAWRKSDNSTITPSEISQLVCYDGTPTTITISLGGTYYGGTLDVVTGELTVNVIPIKINTLSWGYASGASSPSGKIISTMQLASVIDTTERMIMAEMYLGTKVNFTSQVQNNCINSFSNGMIAVRDDVYDNDVNGWLAEYGEEYIYIKLAEPQTVSLTPSDVALLAGANTLWTDGDNIEITYKAKR